MDCKLITIILIVTVGRTLSTSSDLIHCSLFDYEFAIASMNELPYGGVRDSIWNKDGSVTLYYKDGTIEIKDRYGKLLQFPSFHRVSAQFADGYILIPIHTKKNSDMHFLLDSGTDESGPSKTTQDKHPDVVTSNLLGLDLGNEVDWFNSKTIDIDFISISPNVVADGLLGLDVISGMQLRINYLKHSLDVRKGPALTLAEVKQSIGERDSNSAARNRIIPFVEGLAAYPVQAKMGGTTSLFLFDTGSNVVVFSHKLLKKVAHSDVIETTVQNFGTRVKKKTCIIAKMVVGDVLLVCPQIFESEDDDDRIIGAGYLFGDDTGIIDFPGNRIYLSGKTPTLEESIQDSLIRILHVPLKIRKGVPRLDSLVSNQKYSIWNDAEIEKIQNISGRKVVLMLKSLAKGETKYLEIMARLIRAQDEKWDVTLSTKKQHKKLLKPILK